MTPDQIFYLSIGLVGLFQYHSNKKDFYAKRQRKK